MNILLAGPYLGEFGWEIMMWQAHIRHLAKTKKYDKIICLVRTGHEYLYGDFCKDFIFVDNSGIQNGWRLNGKSPEVP